MIDETSCEHDDIEHNSGPLDELPTLNASALAPGIVKRIVFGPGRFWDDYTVRYFILPPGATVPPHSHDWDHFAISLRGNGRLIIDGKVNPLPGGSWGHVPPNVLHTFENTGEDDFAFICIVPTRGDPHAIKIESRAKRTKKTE